MGVNVIRDTKKLDELIASNPGKLDKFLRGVAIEFREDVRLSFGTSPDGRKYKRGNVVHTASIEGYPPNVDTGNLRAGITWERLSIMHYRVYSQSEYSKYLEDGIGMGKRPFIAPVLLDWQQKIEQEMKKERLFD